MIPPTLIRRLLTDVPFLADGALASLFAQPDLQDMQAAEHPVFRSMRESLKPQVTRVGSLAVLPINGVLARNPHPLEMVWYDMEDTAVVLSMVEAAGRDEEVKGILLEIDSPGGFLTGGPEIGDAVRRIKAYKPVVAWSGGMMASLAYWIGSQASEVISSRSAVVGSIGVYASLYDVSKRFEDMGIKVELFKNQEASLKAIGVPGTTLTDAQRSHLQGSVQASFAEFRQAILSARDGIPEDAMRGQTFYGSDAQKVNLVDRVGDKAFALSVLKSLVRGSLN